MITYRENVGLGELSIGQWLGVNHKVGQDMSYWILPVSGIGILCTTVQRLTRSEKATDKLEARMSDYDTNTDESLDVKNSDLILQEQGLYR